MFDGLPQAWTPIKITLFQRDFIQSSARDELSGDRGAKQLEGTWRLLQLLSQEIVPCSAEGQSEVVLRMNLSIVNWLNPGLPKIIKIDLHRTFNREGTKVV